MHICTGDIKDSNHDLKFQFNKPQSTAKGRGRLILRASPPAAGPVSAPNWVSGGSFWVQFGDLGGHFGSKLGFLRVILAPNWGVWAILAPSWVSWDNFGSMLDGFEAILAPSWGVLGPFWLQVGRSWGHLGSNLGGLGAILAPTWGILEPTGGILEPTWGILRPTWGILEAFCF